jgi:hypothetical protein
LDVRKSCFSDADWIFALDRYVSDSWMASQGGVRRLRVRDGKHFRVASLRMIKRRVLSGEPGLAEVPEGQVVHVVFPVKTWKQHRIKIVDK